MRNALLLVLVVVLNVFAAGQEQDYEPGLCPRLPTSLSERQKYWFQGTIGSASIRMYLERSRNLLSGVFYDTADWTPHAISGSSLGDQIEIADAEPGLPALGRLTAQLTSAGLAGSVIAPKGSSSRKVTLQTYHPESCEQPRGEWARYEDPALPITFEYPSKWHVTRTADGVAIRCPDPAEMVYEGREVSITSGTPRGSELDVYQCGERWVYGSVDCGCDVQRPGCHAATTKAQGGIIILGADVAEWRTYCLGGGYVGLGDGKRRVLLIGAARIEVISQGSTSEIVERITDSARKRD